MQALKLVLVFLTFSAFFAYSQQNSGVSAEYENAYAAYEEGKIDESYIFLKRSLNNDPNHLPSKILMGQVLALSAYYEDAKIEFEEALFANADPNLIVESYIRVLMMLKQYTQVLDVTEAQLTPKRLGYVRSAKAIAHGLLGDTTNAEKYHNLAYEAAPNNPVVLNGAANFYLKNKSYEQAQKYLDESIEADLNVAETYLLLGRLYSKQNNPDLQIKYLSKGLEIAPEHPAILRDLVTAYTGINDFSGAKEVLEKTLAASPNDPMGNLLFAWVAANLDEGELAQQTLEELVNNLSLIESEEMNNNNGMLLVSAMSNYAANNLELAKNQFEQYLNKSPNNFNVAKLLSDVYRREGAFVTAAKLLERYTDNIEQDIGLIAELCEVYILAGQNHKCNQLLVRAKAEFGTTDAYIQTESRLYAARGKLNLALESLEKLKSEDLSAIAQKAIISIRANELDKAQGHIEKLLAVNPDSVDFLNLKASTLKKRNSLSEAEEIYRDILTKDREHFAAAFNLTSILYSTDRLSEAKRLAESLVERRPTDADLLVLYGRVLTLNNETELALEILNRAQLSRRNNPELSDAFIDLFIVKNDFEQALRYTNDLIKNDFTNPRLISTRANLLNALGRNEDAIQDLRVLFGLQSKNPDALYQLSLTQRDFNDVEGALKSLVAAQSLNPDDFFIRRDIARLALATGQSELAINHIDWLTQQLPNNPDVLLLRADLAMTQDNQKGAAALYHSAIRQNNSLAPALIASYRLANQNIGTKGFEAIFEDLSKAPNLNTFATHLYADYNLSANKLDKAKVLYISISGATNYVALPMVLNNLANIYISENKIDAAYNFAQQAYEMLQSNSSILDTLGWIYSLQANYEQALDLLRQAYSMNAQDPNLRYHLAYTLAKLGRVSESKRELNIILDDFGNFPKRKDAEALKADLETL